jgi:hypothetical protein
MGDLFLIRQKNQSEMVLLDMISECGSSTQEIFVSRF